MKKKKDVKIPKRRTRPSSRSSKGGGLNEVGAKRKVGETIDSKILHYINSTKNPSATILGSTEIRHFKPAPVVASFSSRGPGSLDTKMFFIAA